MKPSAKSHAQHWLYPINADAGFTFVDPRTNKTMPATVKSLISMIEALKGGADYFPLSSGYKMMRPLDHLWIYVGLPLQQLVAVAVVNEVYSDKGDWFASFYWDLAATRALRKRPIPLSDIGRAPQSVRRALSVESVTTLDAFCKEYSSI